MPKDVADSGLVFIRESGGVVVYRLHESPVTQAFAIASNGTINAQHGRGFSALRKTFRTVASESLDEPAADLIMGHSRGDMANVYQQTISDERLEKVSEYVRHWLWPDTANTSEDQ